MSFQSENIELDNCPRAEIAEYLDGELSLRSELEIELHFAQCKLCSEELKAQEKVSTTLEILLEDEEKEGITLPENFTKIVTTNAESNLDGLRSPKERSRALFICCILFLMVLFGFGTKGETVLFAVEKFSDQSLAVGGFILHLFYTLALGVSAIFGSLCMKFVFTSTLTLLGIVTAFVITALILSRMVFRFNRT